MTEAVTSVTPGSGNDIGMMLVTNLNGVAVTSRRVQRIIQTFRTADNTAVDPALGAGAATPGTQRVVIASDQVAFGVTVAGVSTAAKQDTIITHVDGIEGLLGTANGYLQAIAGGGSQLYDVTELSGVAVTANATVVEVFPANPNRKDAVCQNTSKTGYVWFHDDGDVSIGGAGCTLIGPLGSYFSMSKGRITCIKDTGSADCLVTAQEGVE